MIVILTQGPFRTKPEHGRIGGHPSDLIDPVRFLFLLADATGVEVFRSGYKTVFRFQMLARFTPNPNRQ